MGRTTNSRLDEGSSISGTYLYKSKHDAEGIARMLGLEGAFEATTSEGTFWKPGRNEEELRARIYRAWDTPPPATAPKPHILSFRAYLQNNEDK